MTGPSLGMTAVASMYGSCIFIGHDYVLNTIRVDNGNIPTLIVVRLQPPGWSLVVGWRAQSTSSYGTGVVGHLKKARLSQLIDSSSRTSVFATSYSRTSTGTRLFTKARGYSM